MSHDKNDRKSQPATDIPPDLATRMLRLGVAGPRRGVDDLIDRLRTPDGWDWWLASMSELGEGSSSDASARLVEGKVDLKFLQGAKELHKARMAQGNPIPKRLASMAAYYACIAAAQVHHKMTITGQNPELLSEALADLAAATPEPWSDLIGKAAMTLSKDR